MTVKLASSWQLSVSNTLQLNPGRYLPFWPWQFNSLPPGKCRSNLISEHMLWHFLWFCSQVNTKECFFNDKSTSVQVMACCWQSTSHYLSQCWLMFLTIWHHYGHFLWFCSQVNTKECFFNDKSTSVQVMACCWQSTSHYLSQCWLMFLTIWHH